METQQFFNLVMVIAIIAVAYINMHHLKGVVKHLITLGDLVSNTSRQQALKPQYFDLQAREMQRFIEEMLGRDFNVDCKFRPTGKADEFYHLWIWKRYETRDMGCMINATSIPQLVSEFMRMYYSTPYFTDATAFPKD